MAGLDGTGRHDVQMEHDVDVGLARRLEAVQLGGERFSIDGSRPFIGFMSETQGFLGCAHANSTLSYTPALLPAAPVVLAPIAGSRRIDMVPR